MRAKMELNVVEAIQRGGSLTGSEVEIIGYIVELNEKIFLRQNRHDSNEGFMELKQDGLFDAFLDNIPVIVGGKHLYFDMGRIKGTLLQKESTVSEWIVEKISRVRIVRSGEIFEFEL